jgi:hypothetical protein
MHMPRTGCFILALAACSRGEPPAPDVSPSVALPEMPVPALSEAPSAPAPSVISLPVALGPADAGSSRLPQTREMPSSSSPTFEAGASALWEAIVHDDPSIGMSFFFPLDAYEQVKDVGDPAADWKRRLVAAYERDIHRLHARLGDASASARMVALEIPKARARWVEPGEEWNKLGYFRVFGSKLKYEIDGAEGAFEVKSLISWRGQWYVVHLSAIK